MNDPYIAYVESFIKSIAPWANAYSVCGLSYLAVADDKGWALLHGRLFLGVHAIAAKVEPFCTKHLVAGYISLSASVDGHAEFIRSLFHTGEINSPFGKLTLRKETAGFGAFHTPFHQAGLSAQNRLGVLVISGKSRHGLLDKVSIDWELRASPQPYESLNELEADYILAGYGGDSTAIEVVANPVVSVAVDSRVTGTSAEVTLLAASGLDVDKCRLGYRVVSNRIVVKRGSFAGREMIWSTDGSLRRGVGNLEIPQAAALECFASYGDCTQHYYWVSDPQNFQNPLRMAFQTCDTNLEVVRDYLFEEKQERRESRHFEHGVALLAWMLGFSSAQPGSTPRLSDAIDIIATTPKGDMLVIECTTGLLRADNKLPKLVDRALAIRNSLSASGHGHVRVLPVMVTARETGSVQAEIPLAESAGVNVVSKETLRDLLNSTVGLADPQNLFDRMWTATQARLTHAGGLPDQLGVE